MNTKGITALLFVILAIIIAAIIWRASDKEGNDNNQIPELTQSYTNSDFDIALQTPDTWTVTEYPSQGAGIPFGINIFPTQSAVANDVPVSVHADASEQIVTIWPQGYGTELPSGDRESFETYDYQSLGLQFAVDEERSWALLLADETAWGYVIAPTQAIAPEQWDNGYIFAQAQVDGFAAQCFDDETGQELDVATQCDPLEGDDFVRSGSVSETSLATVLSIVQSIQLDPIEQEESATDIINVELPLPNNTLESPIELSGQARGYWFFEGSAPVQLLDKDGQVLAETSITAQGDWMTEEFVDFSGSIEFEMTESLDDTRGQVVFQRSNPSGLPENAMEYSVPVIFLTQE